MKAILKGVVFFIGHKDAKAIRMVCSLWFVEECDQTAFSTGQDVKDVCFTSKGKTFNIFLHLLKSSYENNYFFRVNLLKPYI
jgi:hypothetical protein